MAGYFGGPPQTADQQAGREWNQCTGVTGFARIQRSLGALQCMIAGQTFGFVQQQDTIEHLPASESTRFIYPSKNACLYRMEEIRVGKRGVGWGRLCWWQVTIKIKKK